MVRSLLAQDKGYLPAAGNSKGIFQDANFQLVSSFTPRPRAKVQLAESRHLRDVQQRQKQKLVNSLPTAKEGKPVS